MGDNLINQKELFTYDTQNRLTNWDIHDATTNALLKTNSISYDVMGNIATKSDLNIPDSVTLKYEEPAHPHALSSISGNPDAISNDNLSVIYTDFRKIKMLNEGMTKQYSITYGVDDQRRRTDYTSNDTTQTRYYLGDYEEESDNNGNVKKIHYLSGGAVLIENNGLETLYYGYKDNQGSLIALTDKDGIVVEKYAYDPWGGRRNPADWQLKDTRSSFITNRGYTGHEHLDAFNIINMNGRVYDPVTAMFFSPDPFIQSPENWMNYNRYSYVMNNPTRSTDPTGYYMAELKEERYESSGFDEVNAGGSDARGGGGGLGSDPFGYSANNNYYNNGIYFGSNSNIHQYFIGLSFYNDKLGLTQWYTKNGFAELEQIMNDYSSGSNNAVNSGGRNGTDLDPATIGHNLLWLTYAGGNNPKSYNGDDNYSYVPSNAADYPPIGHDRRYDKLGIKGLQGVLMDTRAIGADWRYVFENMKIVFSPSLGISFTERADALILGEGLGLMALPKSLLQLSTPNGTIEMLMWYNFSNKGVTNIPSKY